jgi:ABC-2 type transport system ATP-binding protein
VKTLVSRATCTPTAGAATVLGVVPWEDRRALAARIGTLFGQRSVLWSELTPRQSLHMLAAVHGLERGAERRRVGALAELLDAADLLDVPVRTLSLGQRMRCELAACMVHDPALLFLDEPTIGLDLLAKQRFRALLVRLNSEQATTIFLTSHDVADVEHVARRAIIVNHGEVVQDSPVASLRAELRASRVVEVGFDAPVVLPDLPGVRVLERDEAGARLAVDGSTTVRAVLDRLLDTEGVADVAVVDPPLEDLIARIYEQART